MLANINSMCIRGIDGIPISVEVDISSGLPDFALVGDLSSAVKEARERVRTAIRNSGYEVPSKRITINLAPADLRKEGTAFELAMALGVLFASEEASCDIFKDMVVLGELSLDGNVRGIAGVLPMVISAKELGYKICMVPSKNAKEAVSIKGINIVSVDSLLEAVDFCKDPSNEKFFKSSVSEGDTECYDVDFSEVNGQQAMRRAAEVAASGMHNLLFVGSPGSGKTMIARRIPTILPELTWEESIEVTRIYSVRGLTSAEHPIKRARPFRSPHHTISAPALVGGGSNPKPGEISLADRGLLFLDELPEFQKSALESLRQPLEDRKVSVVRMSSACIFPANVMLCAAMNPCRCGYYPDRKRCGCSEGEVRKYMQRISRPLLDRIDVCVEAPPVNYGDLEEHGMNESSARIRARVEQAWKVQAERFKDSGILFNSQMGAKEIKEFCKLGNEDKEMMETAFETMGLSARGYHRILKVARTLADMAGEGDIKREHLLEALGYRSIEEKIWG